mmetsp:Transcript_16589/g.29611  ORF Transcript_16589/g.29611 Transcript_16589/m.29611 type:complete len:202 (-) Transcript_16589:345-950(-)
MPPPWPAYEPCRVKLGVPQHLIQTPRKWNQNYHPVFECHHQSVFNMARPHICGPKCQTVALNPGKTQPAITRRHRPSQSPSELSSSSSSFIGLPPPVIQRARFAMGSLRPGRGPEWVPFPTALLPFKPSTGEPSQSIPTAPSACCGWTDERVLAADWGCADVRGLTGHSGDGDGAHTFGSDFRVRVTVRLCASGSEGGLPA